MRVKLHTRSAGPKGNHAPGAIVEVSEAEGEALIARKIASPVNQSAKSARQPVGQLRDDEEELHEEAEQEERPSMPEDRTNPKPAEAESTETRKRPRK